MRLKLLSICCLLVICFNVSYSQSSYYKKFDSIIGQSQTNLYNGLKYNDKYRASPESHKFYASHQSIKSDIIYDGQPFFDVELKYDLISDLVVIQPKGDKKYIEIQLITDQVKEFTIGKHHFYNLSKNEDLKAMGYSGFFDKSYEGTYLNLYIKSIKKVKERIVGNRLNYTFDQYDTYFLEGNGSMYEVSSKNDFRDIFPDKSDKINQFYKDYKDLSKLSPTDFYKRLIAILDTESIKTTE